MEKKKTIDTKKISSRNRNKNKNRNLQIKAKEKELAKKTKIKKIKNVVNEDLEKNIESIVDVVIDSEVVVDSEKEDLASDLVGADFDDDIEKKKSSNKFKFIDDDTELVISDIDDDCLEEFLEYDNVESVPFKEIKQLEREEIIETDDDVISPPTDNIDINAKKYFSFENRIVILLVLIVVAFFVAGLLIFKSITHTDTAAIVYDDRSNVRYEVCINENANNQYYIDQCLDEDMEYLGDITEKIPMTFEYEMKFNKAVSTKISYYVVSKVNIYREKNGKVLNTMEDVLVERTAHNVFGDETAVAIEVDAPFKKYREYVSNYNNQYGLDSYAELEVVFYVDNGNVIKKASELKLPLTKQTFSIDVLETTNNTQHLTLPNNDWGSVNTSYAVVGVIFVLFGVLGIIRLANLVFKVIGSTSLYQRKLSKILREYDRYIVISRGDYTIDDTKRLVKVTTFGELLDARNTLEKPIVYVKINNVKSEFYVEDSEAIYKYTFKEADMNENHLQ